MIVSLVKGKGFDRSYVRSIVESLLHDEVDGLIHSRVSPFQQVECVLLREHLRKDHSIITE